MTHRQSGIALITAMLVMALCAIAAAAVMTSAMSGIRRAATLIDGEKSWWYAEGLESWGRRIIAYDLEKNGPVDSLKEAWAQPQDLPVEQGGLRGEIEDLQGRFNLNNLGSAQPKKYQEQFARLFQNIEGLDASVAGGLAEAVRDWIDPDQIPAGPGGAEDTDYLSLRPPYRAANQPLVSPTELLAIMGFTPEIVARLAPYVTALPLNSAKAATRINVNTAKDAVLLSLATTMNPEKVKTWLSTRVKEPVDKLDKLRADGTLPAEVTDDLVDVRTHFFEFRASAFIGTGRVALYSVVVRPDSGPPLIIARSLDTE